MHGRTQFSIWLLAAGVVSLLGGASLQILQGAGLPSREEVLALVYPGAEVKAERLFLTSQEMENAGELAGTDIPSALIARYTLWKGGEVTGRAYVDTHVIRTKRQSLLICLDPAGRVKRVEVTAFLEPPEYNLPDAWYAQYEEKDLTGDLRLNQGIRPITGATLTSISSGQAVRRALAIDRLLEEKKGKEGRP